MSNFPTQVRRKAGGILRGLANVTQKPRSGGRVFGVGAAKTGTHTLGEMFGDQLATAHELDSERLIEFVLHRESVADRNNTALLTYLRRRDRWRRLTIDASQVNIYLIDELERLFCDNRYVLTVRSPATWLRSIIDDSLRRNTSLTWIRFRDFRFGAPCESMGAEAPLSKAGLYGLDGYLGYWTDAIQRVTSRVPPERLLVMPTTQIGSRSAEIARFCGVPDPNRSPTTTHSFKNTTRSEVLGSLDPSYVEEHLEAVTGQVARSVFPDWSAHEDLRKALTG